MGVLVDENDLPSEAMLEFYWVYKNVTLSVTIVIAVVTILVMITSTTRSISKYRWYLVHSLIWSLISDVSGIVIGPVLLFPFPCYFSVNSLQTTDSERVVMLFIGVTAMLGKNISVMFQFEHRYVKSQKMNSRYQRWFGFSSLRMEIAIRGAILVAVFLTIEIPVIITLPDQVKQRQIYASLDPVVAKVFQSHPNVVCVSRTLLPTSVLINSIGIIFGGMLIHMHMSIRKNHLTVNTYRMQMMLFWSLVAQMTAMFVFILLPAIVALSSTIFGFKHNPKILICCFCLFFLHTPVDCLLILYFIKPYRDFLWKYLNTKRVGAVRESLSVTVVPGVSIVKHYRGSFMEK